MTITALIPAHNEQATIAQSVRSIIHQVDAVLVVTDNCTDHTMDEAKSAGASVMQTVGNSDKKAGALNQAMPHINTDYVLVMDADTEIGPEFITTAISRLESNPELGAVGGSFFAREESNLIQVMQGNEYARYVREICRRRGARANVLTGAGSIFRLSVLREVEMARANGELPGAGVYNQTALTEDNELSLAVLTLGYKISSPKKCAIYTDAPDTLGDLFRQRVRWRRGAMEDLLSHGFNSVTRPYIMKMVWSLFVTLLSFAYVGLVISIGHLAFSFFWTAVMVVCAFDKWWTIRGRGVKAQLVAGTFISEVAYDLFQQAILIRALYDFSRRAPQVW
jgi:cellulose synthase/poly-beta-1,6-N-acetylglucosamine synthase-like glycosyltransferase